MATIKVISYGKKNGIVTAEVVFIKNGKSRTAHLWQRNGKIFGDMWGANFEIPYKI